MVKLPISRDIELRFEVNTVNWGGQQLNIFDREALADEMLRFQNKAQLRPNLFEISCAVSR